MNVAGIHYGSGNEGQTGLATNINYIIHQILLHNQPCFPHVEPIPQSVVEYFKCATASATPAARSPHPEADSQQSRREGFKYLINTLMILMQCCLFKSFKEQKI